MSTNESTNLNIRIDKEVKCQAEALLNDIGMSLSTAINVFIRQLIKDGGIPFIISTRNNNDGNYNLPYIRQKLEEARLQYDNQELKRCDMNTVMGKYQEKYKYEL